MREKCVVLKYKPDPSILNGHMYAIGRVEESSLPQHDPALVGWQYSRNGAKDARLARS